ncbi:MAG: 4Fe-4S binding protein [Bacteroidales bacterium]|jgi:2-oxoglutarate ferredoxin oxidoreductase subunit delta|nr:4Fe-4S binding protein [Bacteroidales bacterium]
MAKVKGEIVVDKDRCKGCEICTTVCPVNSIGMSNDLNNKGYRYAVTINGDCTGCTNCGVVCPDGVISVYRAKVE